MFGVKDSGEADAEAWLVGLLSVMFGMLGLRVRHSVLPVGVPNGGDYRVYELFHKNSPVPDPFELVAHDQGSATTLALEGADLVGTDTLGQPDGALGGHVFVETLVERSKEFETARVRESMEWTEPLRCGISCAEVGIVAD